MEVIGAGWGRTGTDSTRSALNLLGLPCHHMKEVTWNRAQGKFWTKAFTAKYGPGPVAEGMVDLDFTEAGLGTKFKACVDWPSCDFYKELMLLHPNAKVLLTVRDSGEAWYKSTYNTIYAEGKPAPYLVSRVLPSFLPKIWSGSVKGKMDDKDAAVAEYDAWIASVKAHVPPDRLLVFNVKQGWGPLCKFLGKPVPPGPFPRVNSTEEMNQMRRRMKRNASIVMVVAGALAVVTTALAARGGWLGLRVQNMVK